MNHKHVWEVCKAVPERPGKKVPDNYAPYVPALAPVSFDQELALFAEVFKESYKLRQLADYDPHYRVSASEARAAVTEAREALARFRTADSAWREWFLSMVVIRPR